MQILICFLFPWQIKHAEKKQRADRKVVEARVPICGFESQHQLRIYKSSMRNNELLENNCVLPPENRVTRKRSDNSAQQNEQL